jgi:glycosyltransferase involved in cell wall biosynthesis
MSRFRPCILIPVYNNPATLRTVVEGARRHLPSVVVIDDGSSDETRVVASEIAKEGLAYVHRRDSNGGKGAAVKTGFRIADELGFTHALQIDADGQHNPEDIPVLLQEAKQNTEALILGEPVFDHTVPKGRLYGREITRFWVGIETGGKFKGDALCGFRVYPIRAALETMCKANRMDFDIEILVRMVWGGVQPICRPTEVRYFSTEYGGVSHFKYFWDNLRISWMHFRLVCMGMLRYFRKIR